MIKSKAIQHVSTLFLLLSSSILAHQAYALPLFARQTGMECSACHTTFPELTPFGRQFKLSGYTLGTRQTVPLAGMAIASINRIANNTPDANGHTYGRNGTPVLEGGSLFTGGKINDNVGAFVQWTSSALETDDDHNFHTHSGIDNVDVRAVTQFTLHDKSVLLGATLHNNPTVQDVWNTAPAWSYPYISPSVAAPGYGPASTFLESGSKVAGVGVYAYIDNALYLEASAYRSADKALSLLRAGQPDADRLQLQGSNPYWRATYTWDNDKHHFMIGHTGIDVKMATTPGASSGDHFRDLSFDTQYQYFGDNDKHIVTAQAATIREKAYWDSGFLLGSNDNPTSTLTSQKAKLSYLYEKKYGVVGSVFRTKGDADTLRFGTLNGTPNTAGYTLELQYLPSFKLAFDPQFTMRIGLQYTGYKQFNGSKTNYDGSGRNASGNNTLYLYSWIAF
jgi:hypothetical protein